MSVAYQAVMWNPQKRFYDIVLVGGVALFLVTFSLATQLAFPKITAEILLIRAFGAAAFVMLHVVLCIGPVCRLNRQFLPLLYNRRHAGVTTALLALIHAALVVATYHAAGDANPILAIFTAGGLFQVLGFIALVILVLMATTSHDFWLANLSAPVWKSLHMLVYVAYGLLVLHVAFGVLQAETSPVLVAATATGFVVVLGLHIVAGLRELPADRVASAVSAEPSQNALGTAHATNAGFVDVCAVDDIPDKRARIVCLDNERVAVFKYDGKLAAVSNVCAHQNGPLGEGKIVGGCITCPWHGYQYRPETGVSPPPFTEKVATYNVRVSDGRVLVYPRPNPI
jgi:sulfoxide reductase heme-binding subunit YedZ